MKSDNVSFEFLKTKLKNDIRVNDQEKCVLLLQMFTYVGSDLYRTTDLKIIQINVLEKNLRNLSKIMPAL